MDEAEKKPPELKLPVRPNRISLRPSTSKSGLAAQDASGIKPAVASDKSSGAEAPVMQPSAPPASPKPASSATPEPAGIRLPPSIFDKANLPSHADEIFGLNTMRIELPPEADKKRETTRIELPPAAKKETAKIELPAAAAQKAKSTTMALGVPAAPPSPAKPKRPGTLIMKRPGAAAAPGEALIDQPAKTAMATEQARKSETARIDISAGQLEAAEGKPKTIRIKRPESGSGRKPLSIARPEDKKLTAATMAAPELQEDDEDAPGLAATISAIAALLVAGFLFYMLLAQSIAPMLPFPGKI